MVKEMQTIVIIAIDFNTLNKMMYNYAVEILQVCQLIHTANIYTLPAIHTKHNGKSIEVSPIKYAPLNVNKIKIA